MSNKLRPQNGPGSNGLRGGLNTYSVKTITGPWLEEYGGAARFKRGFTTADFETEAQHAQTGALREKAPEYGAGLPLTEIVVRKPINADVFNPSTDKSLAATRWQTNSQLMNKNVYNKQMTEEVLQIPTLPRDKLEEYRKSWTVDSDRGRDMRFQTESRLAGNCANSKFQVHSIRYLPGAPKAMEEYRERIVARFGVFAVAALRFYVGSGDMSIQDLRTALNNTKVIIKTFEFNQIIAYCTSSPTTINADNFLRLIRGRIDGFNADQVTSVYSSLNDQSLTAITRVINSDQFPEVLEGFKQFGTVYSNDGQTLSQRDFLELHEDMYISLPNKFNEVFRSMWEISR